MTGQDTNIMAILGHQLIVTDNEQIANLITIIKAQNLPLTNDIILAVCNAFRYGNITERQEQRAKKKKQA